MREIGHQGTVVQDFVDLYIIVDVSIKIYKINLVLTSDNNLYVFSEMQRGPQKTNANTHVTIDPSEEPVHQYSVACSNNLYNYNTLLWNGRRRNIRLWDTHNHRENGRKFQISHLHYVSRHGWLTQKQIRDKDIWLNHDYFIPLICIFKNTILKFV